MFILSDVQNITAVSAAHQPWL